MATLPPISDVADVDMDDPVERSGGGGGGLLYGGGGRCGGDADDEAGWASEREDGVLGGDSIQFNGGPKKGLKKA